MNSYLVKQRIKILSALIMSLGIILPMLVYAQSNTDKLEFGRQVYLQNCSVCHGPEGQGRIGANLNKNWPSIRPDLTVRSIIENGVPGSVMPAFSNAAGGPLSDQEIDALMDYILSWQTGEFENLPPIPTATVVTQITPLPEIDGDPNRGAVLFANNCAVCHGADGQGRIGKNLNKVWAGVRPDLNIKSTISQGIPGSTMPAWHQESGGPLTEAEVNDLVAFVLSQSDEPSGLAEPVIETTSPRQYPWLRGWGGIFVLLVLLVVVIGGAMVYQNRSQKNTK
jgi:mono/diheme cytochrome c family protein